MDTPNSFRDALVRAINIIGSQSALARALGKSQPYVPKWLKSRNGLPPEYCPSVERLTHRQVRCEELNGAVDWAYVRHGSLVDHCDGLIVELVVAGFNEAAVRSCLQSYIRRVAGADFFE